MRTAKEPMPVWSFFLQTGEKRNFQGEETFQINTKLLNVKLLQLCPTLCDPMDCSPPGSSVHGDFPGKNTRMGCHALLHGNLPSPGIKLTSLMPSVLVRQKPEHLGISNTWSSLRYIILTALSCTKYGFSGVFVYLVHSIARCQEGNIWIAMSPTKEWPLRQGALFCLDLWEGRGLPW